MGLCHRQSCRFEVRKAVLCCGPTGHTECVLAHQVAWKNHLHMLHPSPAAYAAYMGDVAMWTGIVTGSLMLCSPFLFEKLGWRGVAGATPRFMILTGDLAPEVCARPSRRAASPFPSGSTAVQTVKVENRGQPTG